ncbi:MAG: GPR endopeptidase [Oscillospiraceae bacterium]|jgi:spore protease|nr:GPR endopeptidase [Oscillospiraceae bacterium]
MFSRTDLALETKGSMEGEIEGVEFEEKKLKKLTITKINIKTPQAAKSIGKPMGKYVTVEVPILSDNSEDFEINVKVISDQMKKLIPSTGLVLVIGLGNSSITPDSLGPKTIKTVIATRHIEKEISKFFSSNLRSVAALAPGVLGQTGIEIVEILKSLARKIGPKCVIVVDALASEQAKRLGRAIQISDTGISPGSGVGNSRPLIDEKTIGVPIISVGIPMVVDAQSLAVDLMDLSSQEEIEQIQEKINPQGACMMVTPRDIDVLIERASNLLSSSINLALHPNFDFKDLKLLSEQI